MEGPRSSSTSYFASCFNSPHLYFDILMHPLIAFLPSFFYQVPAPRGCAGGEQPQTLYRGIGKLVGVLTLSVPYALIYPPPLSEGNFHIVLFCLGLTARREPPVVSGRVIAVLFDPLYLLLLSDNVTKIGTYTSGNHFLFEPEQSKQSHKILNRGTDDTIISDNHYHSI